MTDLIYEGLPQTSLEALLSLYDRDGGLRPDAVIEEARNEQSPLHEHFEWDDSEAAHRYRQAQARQLIGKVTVSFRDEPSVNVRGFVSMAANHHREYRKIQDVISNEVSRDQIRRSILRQLVQLQNKLRQLDAFAGLAPSLDDIIDNLRREDGEEA
jgi:hypothetical protein